MKNPNKTKWMSQPSVCVCGMCGGGVLCVYSAAHPTKQPFHSNFMELFAFFTTIDTQNSHLDNHFDPHHSHFMFNSKAWLISFLF